jgi:disulfide bond formation protein DsbB
MFEAIRSQRGWASARIVYFWGAVVCAGLLAFALYLQYYQYQNPCPLCILPRYAFVLLLIVFATAALHGPRRAGAYVYSGLLIAIAAIGASIATRHVWLQHLPPDKVPACGPGLQYMLDRFPLTQALEKIFRGSGECAESAWKLLGLSIAEWSLAWFILLAAASIYAAVLARR